MNSMTRKKYWISTAILLGSIFVIAFIAETAAGYRGIDDGLVTFLNGAGLIGMWIIGAARMDDTRHSQAWAIFAPFVLGLIIIGCLRSATPEERLALKNKD